jgi:hypothetical protein
MHGKWGQKIFGTHFDHENECANQRINCDTNTDKWCITRLRNADACNVFVVASHRVTIKKATSDNAKGIVNKFVTARYIPHKKPHWDSRLFNHMLPFAWAVARLFFS